MKRGALVALVSIPPLLAIVVLMFLVAAEHVDARVVGDRPQNVAEAAATGNAAEVIRMIRAGEDPRRVYPLRARIVSSSLRQATALEAAMWSRTLPMVRLLEDQGFIADPAVRHDLMCLAGDLELPDIAQYLSVAGEAACVKGDAYAHVVARTAAAK
jgi:hypothetical protein